MHKSPTHNFYTGLWSTSFKLQLFLDKPSPRYSLVQNLCDRIFIYLPKCFRYAVIRILPSICPTAFPDRAVQLWNTSPHFRDPWKTTQWFLHFHPSTSKFTCWLTLHVIACFHCLPWQLPGADATCKIEMVRWNLSYYLLPTAICPYIRSLLTELPLAMMMLPSCP